MKCKNCRNLVKRIDGDGTLYDFCGMVIDSPDTDRERNCKYYVAATNADRIRAMTDDELADFILKVGGNIRAGLTPDGGWLDWLQQEAQEGE